MVDVLERRWMLAAQAGVWRITGTPGDDLIELRVSEDGRKIRAFVDDRFAGAKLASKVKGVRVVALAGNDEVSIQLGMGLDNISATVAGGAGNDWIEGGFGDDQLAGGTGDDEIFGGMGDDYADGGWGDDLISGDEGADEAWGDAGDDTLAGGFDEDSLYGQDGDDRLSGGYEEDVLKAGDGEDTVRGGEADDALFGGDDPDVIFKSDGDRWQKSGQDVLKKDVRANPLKQVEDTAGLKQWLIEQAMKRWEGSFGQPVYRWWYGRGEGVTGGGGGPVFAPGANTGGMSNPPPAAPDHSGTNTQEAGVDEADIVKTDGEYVYLVKDDELVIIDAWPAAEAHVVSTTPLDGFVSGIYLDGDRLTVIAEQWGWDFGAVPGGVGVTGVARMTIAPGYWRNKPKSTVTVFDVSDRSAPDVVSTSTIDGNVTATRDIGGRLYLVVDNGLDLPQPQVIEGKGGYDDDKYETAESYRARLEAMSLDDMMPDAKTVANGQTTTRSLVLGADLFTPTTDRDPYAMFSVLVMDVADDVPTPAASASVIGGGGTVYMSTDALYVTAQGYEAPMGDWWGDHRTDIYKFGLTDDGVAFEGNGAVAGWMVNGFAMDEQGEDFRIATTTSEMDGTSNNVFVLRDAGDTLNVVGSITGLALTERIYAARFEGDRGYLVTFRRVDPLYTLDMSDGTAPKVVGELKIPGYSSYLHPVGEDLVIGLGRRGNDAGQVFGLQASLFDVSDFANPRLIDTHSFDFDAKDENWWDGASSTAEWDHHAFSFFAETGILAIPVLDWGWWNGEATLEVLRVDAGQGFTELGKVRHDGEVLRSLRIGGFLYSIGSDAVKVVKLEDPGEVVATVTLQNDPDPEPWPSATPPAAARSR